MAGPEGHDNRRTFFRRGLAGLFAPLGAYLQDRMGPGKFPAVLRPPGAIDEPAFSDTCVRCGVCAQVCPVKAIYLPDGNEGDGLPFIDPVRAPCVLCEGLLCTHECPSGALQPVQEARQVAMGLAVVHAELCVRSAGEDCHECVDACPIGADALRLIDTGPPDCRPAGCVGCGVCQHHCPTDPKAITVQPH